MKLEYDIVTAGDSSIENLSAAIAAKVTRKIAHGWIPTGGVSILSVRTINGEPFYEGCQALERNIPSP